MKKVADEREPIIGVAEVAEPVQVRFTLVIVPPHVARLLVAIERIVPDTFLATAL